MTGIDARPAAGARVVMSMSDVVRASAHRCSEAIRANNGNIKTDGEQLAFIGGAVWAADRLPSREEIERAIMGRTANRAADAVLALIREKVEGGNGNH